MLERSRERLLNYCKILHKKIFILKTKTHIKFEFTLSSTEVRNTTKHYLFKKTQLWFRRRENLFLYLRARATWGRSLKYGCFNACLAEIRLVGLYNIIFLKRSCPSAHKFGHALAAFWAGHWGNVGLKSGREETPGHIDSLGVPRSLKMRNSISISLSPGHRGRLFASSAKMHPMDHISTPVE